MGFEVKIPPTWAARPGVGTTFQTVLLDEPRQTGKPHLAVQIIVQRDINPRSLPIAEWFADRLQKFKSPPVQSSATTVGGRPTIRWDLARESGNNYQFFTAINRIDIFQITINQPPNQPLDPVHEAVIASVRFLE